MQSLIERLQLEWQRTTGPLFVNDRIKFDIRPVSTRTLRADWLRFCAEADIEPRGTHCLRRTFATEIADRTDNAMTVNHALGHERASIGISAEYVDRNPKKLARAMQQIYKEDTA
jgi:integrase